MTHEIVVTPPNADLYAAVQVEAEDGKVLGAMPAYRMKDRPTGRMVEVDGKQVPETVAVMAPLERVPVRCHPGHPAVVRWVYEDDSRGTTTTTFGQPRRGGGR